MWGLNWIELIQDNVQW